MNKKLVLLVLSTIIILAILIFLMHKGTKISLSLKQGNKVAASAQVAQARDFESKGSLGEAKVAYQNLIRDFPESRDVLGWQKKSEELNLKLLFSPATTPKSVLYEIKPGDTLNKIAKEFKTTVELISKSNNLASDRIIPGKKIKVWTAPFSIMVDKSQNTLILKSDDEIIKTYIVSTGLNNSTLSGTFKIINKLQNPIWFRTGTVVPANSPENILGSRWLGFNLTGYGIHGTTDPQSLGKQVTQGCVRMSNTDVEELYSIVPVGTEVTIVD